jgi:hypothetical protein
MAATQQSQAIQVVNTLISLSTQLMNVYQQMVALDAAWTDQGAATVIAALGTVAINADGSLGAADGAPNVAHPLDPAKYPTLSHSLSSNQIAQCKTILDGLVSYVNGQAVTTQIGARAILNAAVGG